MSRAPTLTGELQAGSASPKRDLRFDTVRGALLVMMALNHIDSQFRALLDQPLGFVTSAEGFVFLSGIVIGRLDHAGVSTQELDRRAWRRAKRAYFCHAIGLVGVWLWVQAWLALGQETPWRLPYLFFHAPWQGLLSGLALLYQPGLLDILPMYVGFPLLVPLVVRMHRQGQGLLAWGVSAGIWALDQWLSPPVPFVWGPINTGAFHFLSWQWLFVTGVLLGAEPKWERRALDRPKPWLVSLVAAGAMFLWVARHPGLPRWWDLDTLSRLTQKTPLAALRFLNFGLIAFLIAVLGSRHPRLLVAKPLALLGQHSLAVFTASIWCAQICLSFPESSDTPEGRWIQTAFVILSLVLTAAACEAWTRHQDRFAARSPTRRKVYSAEPPVRSR